MEEATMFKIFPKELLHEWEARLTNILVVSLNYRWKGIIYTALILIVMLIPLALVPNLADGFVVAVAVSVSTLCIVAAIYTAVAALLVQREVISTLLIHYGEIHDKKGNIKENN